MRELLRSNDMVMLSFMQAVLAEADVAVLVLDGFTSAVEGSIGAVPRRLMVTEDDYEQARRIVSDLQREGLVEPVLGEEGNR